jgi:hypothetical protein
VKLSRATIALYVGLVFACGVVLGIFGERLYLTSTVIAQRPNPDQQRKELVSEFQSRLKLDEGQVSQLNMIMDETQARVMDIRKQMHPSYMKVREEQNQKIHNMLRPEQQVEFDRILKEREERHKQGGGRGGPGGGI